mgnify:CR=1 FL=1
MPNWSDIRTERAFRERDEMLLRGDDPPDIERCCVCDEPTGKAGREEDSLYGDDDGPYCETCYDKKYPEEE